MHAQCTYLSTKPQLSCQTLLKDIIRELDTKVPWCPLVGDHLLHDLLHDVEHLVLADTQLVDQIGAALGVLATVETVQLFGHHIELFIRVEELGQQ